MENKLTLKSNNQSWAYSFHEKDKIGKGSFAKVYKGLLKEKNENTKDTPVKIKIIDNNLEQFDNELGHTKNYYKVYGYSQSDKKRIIISEFLPGKPLFKLDKYRVILPEEIYHSGPKQRFDIICSILSQVNLFHHDTPTTRGSIIHSDITHNNILFTKSMNKNNKEVFKTFIIDFGLSKYLENQEAMKKVIGEKINIFYAGPESVKTCLLGLKSDIYSLTPIIAAILGAKYVIKNKFKAHNINNLYHPWFVCEESYNIYDAFPSPKFNTFPVHLKYLTMKFLNLMQSKNYEKRPDIDTTLKFFLTINNILIPSNNYDPKISLIENYNLVKSNSYKKQMEPFNKHLSYEDHEDLKKIKARCDNEQKLFANSIINLKPLFNLSDKTKLKRTYIELLTIKEISRLINCLNNIIEYGKEINSSDEKIKNELKELEELNKMLIEAYKVINDFLSGYIKKWNGSFFVNPKSRMYQFLKKNGCNEMKLREIRYHINGKNRSSKIWEENKGKDNQNQFYRQNNFSAKNWTLDKNCFMQANNIF